MKQESNPFSQFVTDPSSIPDPNKMTRTDFLNYTSYEIEKSNAALRMMKKSLPFMAGIIGLSILGMIYAQSRARCELFGSDKKGGSYLDILTMRSEADFAYNRQFQRKFHGAQGMIRDPSRHSPKLLTDLGVTLPQYGSTNIPKRSAHPKYY